MADNIEISDVSYLYLSEAKLMPPKYKVKKIDTGRGRWYYRKNDRGQNQFYISITSFISKSLPQADEMVKWIADMGYWESKAYASERAAYGSVMHSIFAYLIIDNSVNLTAIRDMALVALRENKLPESKLEKWTEDLVKDTLAFNQFLIDYEVEPLAMEITLCSEKYGFAGTLDFPVIMNEKLYTKTSTDKRKRIKACIDFKSGRKGFHEANELQLEACKMLWEENYPEKDKFDKIYNWSPKDWKDKPDYNLKDQTDSISIEKLIHYLEIGKIEGRKYPPKIFTYSGELKCGYPCEKNYKIITLDELITEQENKLLNELRTN